MAARKAGREPPSRLLGLLLRDEGPRLADHIVGDAHVALVRVVHVTMCDAGGLQLVDKVGGLLDRPILLAYVWRDNKKATERLLELGANVNLRDADGDTALHGAAESGNVEIMRLLLDKGADPNTRNKQGGTPLMWAAVFGNDEAARLLLTDPRRYSVQRLVAHARWVLWQLGS